ncbi:MAG: hypothetical protein H0X07_09210, partial [Gemmatimonadales bacterium]|nr:hypothetical protein [Gemmatimonadales bacterium]
MSGILGVFGLGACSPDDRTVRSMLAGLARRGTECNILNAASGEATLATGRFPWEFAGGLSGPVSVVEDGALAVAADAGLYYQRDLRRQLQQAGVPVRGSTPSHLILAAYRAWGERCAERLEGDFAFVLWDGDKRRVVCARDFGGKRPLFHAQFGGTLAVASTIP